MSGRTRIALAAVVAALSLAVVAAPASAGVLDQQQTSSIFGSGIDGPGAGGFSDAQTFTPALSGGLDQVDLLLARFATTNGPLTVEIRDVSVAPQVVLASASVAAEDVPVETGPAAYDWIAVPFGDPAPVQAGGQYAIVVYTGGSDHYGWRSFHGTDIYAGGQAFGSTVSPPTTNGASFFPLCGATPCDFAFKTYVTETYDFSGFFAPVNNPTDPEPVNSVKAGASVPVKFSLGGDQGLDVLADGYPKLAFTPCDPTDEIDPLEETSTANSGLTYNALTDTYNYVWKTNKSWSGKCGTFTLKLNDGSVHTADFQFK
jgi:hypothetical protein